MSHGVAIMVAVVLAMVTLLLKVLAEARAVINMKIELFAIDDVVAESLTDVVTVRVIDLDFVMSVPSFVLVLSEVVLDDEALVVGIGGTVFILVNTNISAAVRIASELPIPIPYEEPGCSAAFGCRRLATFNCVRVLQARMPSDHV